MKSTLDNQGNVVGLGKHGHVGQRSDTVAAESGHTAMGVVESLDNQAVVSSCDELVKSGLAGDS